mmetsp:Transcript_2984/g.6704  ORF Transcript_2984/g.6704 Transcript_2984/m.6704 type:complete len:206 (-) Transcript_2984:380-997(-)
MVLLQQPQQVQTHSTYRGDEIQQVRPTPSRLPLLLAHEVLEQHRARGCIRATGDHKGLQECPLLRAEGEHKALHKDTALLQHPPALLLHLALLRADLHLRLQRAHQFGYEAAQRVEEGSVGLHRVDAVNHRPPARVDSAQNRWHRFTSNYAAAGEMVFHEGEEGLVATQTLQLRAARLAQALIGEQWDDSRLQREQVVRHHILRL